MRPLVRNRSSGGRKSCEILIASVKCPKRKSRKAPGATVETPQVRTRASRPATECDPSKLQNRPSPVSRAILPRSIHC